MIDVKITDKHVVVVVTKNESGEAVYMFPGGFITQVVVLNLGEKATVVCSGQQVEMMNQEGQAVVCDQDDLRFMAPCNGYVF